MENKMQQLIETREKYIATPEKSAAREFVEHLCDTIKKNVKMPDDFNKNYVPHKRIALALSITDRVYAFMKMNGKVAASELRGLLRVFRKVHRE
jgi:hypothetical protein